MIASSGGNGSCILKLACLMTAWLLSWAAIANEAPNRIVSINLCADELLLELLPDVRIASLSWLIRDPNLSWYSDQASNIPVNDGSVEEIIGFAPDLVVAGAFSSPATVTMLERLGIDVLRLDLPTSLEAVRAQLQLLGERLGVRGRAAQLVAGMNERLAELNAEFSPQVPPTTAVVYRPNGLTANASSLAHDILRHAGLRNLAVNMPGQGYRRVDLEGILLAQPDVLIFDHHQRGAPSMAVQMLDHVALSSYVADGRLVRVPAQAWTCGSPRSVEAVAALRAVAEAGR